MVVATLSAVASGCGLPVLIVLGAEAIEAFINSDIYEGHQ